jgi:hypothetical protein
MNLRQFAGIVEDWRHTLTPKQFRQAVDSLVAMNVVLDLPMGVSVERALAAVLDLERAVAKREEKPALPPSPPRSPAPIANPASIPSRPARGGRRGVGERARTLVREQLQHGPRPESHVVAAAKASAIPERSLIAAADALGVRARRGQWRLP